MRRLLPLFLVFAGMLAGAVPAALANPGGERVEPLPQAHAHNDYAHTRPLFDALDQGFTSVEADVFLVDGELLIGHDYSELDPARTLQSLYLEPLRERVLAEHGTVYQGYRGQSGIQLLIDIKTEGESTYAALETAMRDPRYAFLWTTYDTRRQPGAGKVKPGPVTAVISGNRPRATMQAQTARVAFYDGRIGNPVDLGVGADPRLVPLVSQNWTALFSWSGNGPMPEAERARLLTIVAQAHATGQRVRFWATPDQPGTERDAVWTELARADVDHINTDDLAGLANFLRH